ncbi:hypothetical protein HMPREF9086_1792 [Enterobacter hormaechei ATCC 49162]|nr:hypothetical protein HMPREF9086_1792 [Enterobacter hormaechei ATCC 49162]
MRFSLTIMSFTDISPCLSLISNYRRFLWRPLRRLVNLKTIYIILT